MKLSFSTLGCPEWTWSEITSIASDLGYDAIEIRGIGRHLYAPNIPQFAPGALQNTLQHLAKQRLKISCLTTGCELFLKERYEQNVQEVKDYITLAKACGVEYVRIMGEGTPEPSLKHDEAFITQVIGELLTDAQQNGVTLLLENNGYFSNSATLANFVQKLNHPNLGVLWDIHHSVWFGNESVATTYQNLAPYVKHVHLKDSVREDGQISYKMPGDGALPLKEMLTLLQSGGYDGCFSLEWVRRWDPTLEEAGIVFAKYVSYMHAL